MQKVPITENFLIPQLNVVNKNEDSTQLILMNPQQSTLYLLHQYYCIDPNDYRQLITLLQKQAIQGYDSPYVLNPVMYLPIKFTNQQLQTSHFVQVLYEYGSHTLQQQLYLRIKQKNYFQQHEIWSILGSCILGLKHLKQKQLWHNSICLNDIFVTKQGNIKVCHPMFRTYDHETSIYTQQNYIQRAIDQGYFFAPQQITNEKKIYQQRKSFQNKKNLKTLEQYYFKSDIFSLALITLSLCKLNLKSSNQFYIQIKNNSINKIYLDMQRIQDELIQLSEYYSQSLLNIIARMLIQQPENRISVDQLAAIIGSLLNQDQNNQKKYNNEIQQNSIKQNGNQISPSVSNTKRTASKHQRQKYSNNKIGKYSRVSQASQFSTGSYRNFSNKKSTNSFCDYNESYQDQEDKPSLKPYHCQIDSQKADNLQLQTQVINQSFISTGNKTLSNYINQEEKIDQVSQNIVNCTLQNNKYQQQQNKKRLQNFPKQVVSIMTSKNLASLSDDASSYVIERHFANDNKKKIITHEYYEQNKQNIQNHSNMITNNNQNSFRLYLNNIKDRQDKQNLKKINQHQLNYNEKSNKKSPKVNFQLSNCKVSQFQRNENPINKFVVSARNHNQKEIVYKHQNVHSFTTKNYNNNKIPHVTFNTQNALNSNSKNNQKECKSSHQRHESLNLNVNNIKQPSSNIQKDYLKYYQKQTKNSTNLYTDPQFLKVIREDMDKIMKKRGMTVTMGKQNILLLNQQNVNNKKKQQHYLENQIHSNIITHQINKMNNNFSNKILNKNFSNNLNVGPKIHLIHKLR